LPSDDIPPVWMWPLADEINGWFDDVRARHEEEARNPGSHNSDDEPEWEDNDLVPAQPRRRR
jgi:hypothetical protein